MFLKKRASEATIYRKRAFQGFLDPIQKGTIHLRRQHVLGGEGYPHVPMVKRSQYIRIENPLHKHFAGMPMVGGEGSKVVKNCRRLKWMVPKKLKASLSPKLYIPSTINIKHLKKGTQQNHLGRQKMGRFVAD